MIVIKIIIAYFFFMNFFYLYADNIGSDSGFKLPRYVSLKSNEVNLRIGSSKNYPIKLKYTKKNFPIEIIQEYNQWREVKDFEGNKGWIHKSLLKGERYALADSKNKMLLVYNKPNGKLIGEIGNYNIVKLKKCLKNWCQINIEEARGWSHKRDLWGVYQDEIFNIPIYQPVINQFWKISF